MWSRTRPADGRARLAVAAVAVAAAVAAAVAGGGDLHASGAADGPGAGGTCRTDALAAGEEAPRKDCCFTHPAYSGVCVVEPAEGETCASILLYLNDEQSTGHSYCNYTNLRGRWRQVRCADEAPPASESGER